MATTNAAPPCPYNAGLEAAPPEIRAAMGRLPVLPKDFDDQLLDVAMPCTFLLYDKKKSTVRCMRCGASMEIPEAVIGADGLGHGNQGKCPQCGRDGTFLAAGRGRNGDIHVGSCGSSAARGRQARGE
jgi:ribosomal protein S27AE